MFSIRANAFMLAVVVLPSSLVVSAAELRNDIGDKSVSRVVRASFQDAAAQPDAASLPTPQATPQDASPIGSGAPSGEIVYEGEPSFLDAIGDYQNGPFLNDAAPGHGCSTCGPGVCGHGCRVGGNWWIDMDYLLWWRKGSDLPPLVTTAPSGTNPALGTPGTVVLFGNETVGQDARAGGRLSFGHWFDPCKNHGIEVRYVWMGDAQATYNIASRPLPVLGIPFLNAATGAQDVFVIANDSGDPTRAGAISVSASSDVSVWDVAFRKRLMGCGANRLDFLVGYQAARIDDSVRMQSSSIVTGGTSQTNGTRIDIVDDFSTTNEYHAAVIGLVSHCNHGPFVLRLRGSIAFGSMDQTVSIRGQRTTTVPPSSVRTVNEGLFAQSTNIGDYSAEEFVVMPELGANLMWRITDCIDFSLGYSLLYWSDVALSGNQIDTTVNLNDPSTFTTATARPVFNLHSDYYWVHGLSAGVSLRF